jgi:hypothetical protein
MNDTPEPAPVLFTLENIKSIVDWQLAGFVHPLTCGNDSSHPDLLPTMGEVLPYAPGNVTMALVCVQCGYKQTHIPETCITSPRDPAWLQMRDMLSGKSSPG